MSTENVGGVSVSSIVVLWLLKIQYLEFYSQWGWREE